MTAHADPDLTITSTRDGDTLRVTLAGELDLATSPRFRSLVGELPGSPPPRHVVLDVAHLRYVDSVGVGLLVSARQRVDTAEGELSIVNATPATRQLLEISGLTEYLGLVV